LEAGYAKKNPNIKTTQTQKFSYSLEYILNANSILKQLQTRPIQPT